MACTLAFPPLANIWEAGDGRGGGIICCGVESSDGADGAFGLGTANAGTGEPGEPRRAIPGLASCAARLSTDGTKGRPASGSTGRAGIGEPELTTVVGTGRVACWAAAGASGARLDANRVSLRLAAGAPPSAAADASSERARVCDRVMINWASVRAAALT